MPGIEPAPVALPGGQGKAGLSLVTLPSLATPADTSAPAWSAPRGAGLSGSPTECPSFAPRRPASPGAPPSVPGPRRAELASPGAAPSRARDRGHTSQAGRGTRGPGTHPGHNRPGARAAWGTHPGHNRPEHARAGARTLGTRRTPTSSPTPDPPAVTGVPGPLSMHYAKILSCFIPFCPRKVHGKWLHPPRSLPFCTHCGDRKRFSARGVDGLGSGVGAGLRWVGVRGRGGGGGAGSGVGRGLGGAWLGVRG